MTDPTAISRMAARALVRAGITSPARLGAHIFRHTTALHLLQAGVDIAVIALWLGHESIETTHIYLEIDLAHKEQALHKLAPVEGPMARFTAPDPLLALLSSL